MATCSTSPCLLAWINLRSATEVAANIVCSSSGYCCLPSKVLVGLLSSRETLQLCRDKNFVVRARRDPRKLFRYVFSILDWMAHLRESVPLLHLQSKTHERLSPLNEWNNDEDSPSFVLFSVSFFPFPSFHSWLVGWLVFHVAWWSTESVVWTEEWGGDPSKRPKRAMCQSLSMTWSDGELGSPNQTKTTTTTRTAPLSPSRTCTRRPPPLLTNFSHPPTYSSNISRPVDVRMCVSECVSIHPFAASLWGLVGWFSRVSVRVKILTSKTKRVSLDLGKPSPNGNLRWR